MKFTPSLCYLLGLWWHCKSKEGIGVVGRSAEKFVEYSLKENLADPEKIQIDEEKAYFYHHRIKNALKKYVESRKHRLRFANEFSASYLAGWFDCCGEIDEGKVVLCNADLEDKFILTQLNFKFDERGRKILLRRPAAFLSYIKDYAEVMKGEIENALSVARKR